MLSELLYKGRVLLLWFGMRKVAVKNRTALWGHTNWYEGSPRSQSWSFQCRSDFGSSPGAWAVLARLLVKDKCGGLARQTHWSTCTGNANRGETREKDCFRDSSVKKKKKKNACDFWQRGWPLGLDFVFIREIAVESAQQTRAHTP